MKKEYSPEGLMPEESSFEEQKTAAADLKFIRSVIEKTHRAFDPGSPVMIALGLIFMIGYPATQYFLTTPQLYELIQPMWIILWVIGASVIMFYGIIAERREKQVGLISQLSKQIGWIWYILLLNGTAWSGIGLSKGFFGDPGFLWAAIFGFGLSITGILSSKEWLFGGLAIFIAILAAFFIKDYAYLILGLVMGLGCIIPAIIAHRNYRKQEKNYE
ncbi:MAG: hypothetical protein ACYS1A_13040 [Planctomycetota bacterium]|jgi:hypothetical protein